MTQAQLLAEVERRREPRPSRALLRRRARGFFAVPLSPQRGVVIAIGFALLALVLIAVPLVLFFPTQGNEAPPVATPAPPATSIPATAVPPTTALTTTTETGTTAAPEPVRPDMGNLVWTARPMAGIDTPPAAIAPAPGGFVALAEGCMHVLASSDLVTWEAVATLDSSPMTGCSIAGAPDGPLLVIANPYDAAPRVWTSSDGRTWTKTSAGFADGDVVVASAATQLGFVAVGSDLDELATVWMSSDGRAWTTIFQPEDSGVAASHHTVAADGGLMVVGGSRFEGGSFRPSIWTSRDGVTWSAGALPAGCESGSVDSLVAGPNGFAAIGICMNDGDSVLRSGVYHSADGVTWTLSEAAAFADLAITYSAATGEAGYAFAGIARRVDAAGLEHDAAAVWTSLDGLRWSRYDLALGNEPWLTSVGAAEVAVTASVDGVPTLWSGVDAE